MISDYLDHLQSAGYSKSTLSVTKYWLEHLQRQFGGRLSDLKPAELSDFCQSLSWHPGPKGKPYSENSINQAVDVVRRFYRWAAFCGLVSKDPASHLRTRRVAPKSRRELTPTEARKLLSVPDPTTFTGCRNRAILGLILETKASSGALAKLDLGHFQPDTGALLLSGRQRQIWSLSDGLQDDLKRYLTQARAGVAQLNEKALFVGKTGRRMTPAAFSVLLRTHLKTAAVPSPYSFS